MALAVVQEKPGGASSGSVTLDTPATVGNLLIFVIRSNSAVEAITLPSGFSSRVTAEEEAGPSCVIIGDKTAVGGETTLTAVGGTNMQCWALEASDTNASFFDKASSDQNTTQAASFQPGSTGTLSQAAELAIVGFGQNGTNGGSEAIGSGFTVGDSATEDRLIAGFLITAATTALNPTGSWTTNRRRTAAIATYAEDLGGATGQPTHRRWANVPHVRLRGGF